MSNDKRKVGDCKKGDEVVIPSRGRIKLLEDPTADPTNAYVKCFVFSSGKEIELAKLCIIY